jgi:hypothetical protein
MREIFVDKAKQKKEALPKYIDNASHYIHHATSLFTAIQIYSLFSRENSAMRNKFELLFNASLT